MATDTAKDCRKLSCSWGITLGQVGTAIQLHSMDRRRQGTVPGIALGYHTWLPYRASL